MPKISAPVVLSAFPSSTDGIWSFPFALTFDKAIHDPTTLRYEVHVDTFPSLGSPNLRIAYSNGANIVSFQNGALGKSFELSLPKRQISGDITWYWKLRINGGGYGGGYVSDWSDVHTFVVPKDSTRDIATSLWDNIADDVAYSKVANSSNLYRIMDMIARELDQALLENTYTQKDLSLEMGRDTSVENNFGKLVGLGTVATEPTVSYRWKVRELFKSFINSPGVVTGIRRVIRTFVGEDPHIFDATNTDGWILGINHIYDPLHSTEPDPIILYSRLDKGFHWYVRIWNSWGLTYDSTVLENYVNLIKPAHTLTTFTYPTQKHAQIRFNIADDWNACSLTDLVTDSSGSLTLDGAAVSGTAETPVIHIANVNAWDVLSLDQVLGGQTILVQLRSSANGVSFSIYEDLVLGQAPISTPLQDYVQLKITISTTVPGNKPVLSALRLDCLHT